MRRGSGKSNTEDFKKGLKRVCDKEAYMSESKKGFAGWIEIFRGGSQTDSRGRVHDGDAIVDKAVATFSAADHEPPAVIGHPAVDGPAWGWVKELKAEVVGGIKTLKARFDQVVPEFADMVQRGMFKKRSAAFYPDGRLRHVGFLGAMPPAVKGLADLKFGEGEPLVFEFGEEELGLMARIFRRLREWLIEKEGLDAADLVVADWEINELQNTARRPQTEPVGMAYGEPVKSKEGDMPEGKMFSEQDVEAIRAQTASEAAAAERKKMTAEFAETQRAERAKATRAEIKKWVDDGVAAGKIAPAWKDGGLQEFCVQLDAEAMIEFGEAGGKKTPLAWFQEFIAGLPKVVEFGEIADRKKDVGGGSAGAKLDKLTQDKMAKDKTLSYTAAFAEVQRAHSGLAAEYAQELR
jgi:hypothetical protein